MATFITTAVRTSNPIQSLFVCVTSDLSFMSKLFIVRVLGYSSGGPSSIPGTTRKKKVVGLERGPLSLVSTTEELLHAKVAVPV
jgi:hypothetical protein